MGKELGDAEEVAFTDCAKVGPFNRWNAMENRGSGEKNEGRQVDILADWKDQPNLKLLNLMYDLTPSDGILPPSSVAVLLREMSPESALKGAS